MIHSDKGYVPRKNYLHQLMKTNQSLNRYQNQSTKGGGQSELGSENELLPLSGTVSPNILIRDEILDNPTQNPSVQFQNESENSLSSRVEMLSDSQNIEELQNAKRNYKTR